MSSTAIPERWLAAARALCAVAGLLSVPVMFMLIETRDLAGAAAGRQRPLPPRYFALFCRWVHCSIFGFSSTMIVLGLMIAKPIWEA